MSNEVAKREETPIASRPQTVTPLDMLNTALERGVTGDELSKFMDLHERWQSAEAKRAFDAALALFKQNPPQVINDRTNLQYGSTYSSLANTVNTVNAELSKYGLSATWEYAQSDGLITVTCVLSHVDGHSIRTTLSGAPDDSGKKNDLQKIKSTTTYLRGATFEAVTGIATYAVNRDDDGNGASSVELLSDEQVANLEAMIEEVGADKAKYLAWCNVAALKEIQAAKYSACVRALELKRGK